MEGWPNKQKEKVIKIVFDEFNFVFPLPEMDFQKKVHCHIMKL